MFCPYSACPRSVTPDQRESSSLYSIQDREKQFSILWDKRAMTSTIDFIQTQPLASHRSDTTMPFALLPIIALTAAEHHTQPEQVGDVLR